MVSTGTKIPEDVEAFRRSPAAVSGYWATVSAGTIEKV